MATAKTPLALIDTAGARANRIKTLKSVITNRMKALRDNTDVTVVFSDKMGTISITHRLHHVPNYVFVWSKDHYFGYIVFDDGSRSQAYYSLWTKFDVVDFMSLYMASVRLCAKRRKPADALVTK